MGNGKSKGKQRQQPSVVQAITSPEEIVESDDSSDNDHIQHAAKLVQPIPKDFISLVRTNKLIIIHAGQAYLDEDPSLFLKIDDATQKQLDVISNLFPARILPRNYFWKKPAFDLDSESRLDFVKILPREIVQVIFQYLDPASYSSAVSACKAWKEFESVEMWSHYCKKYKIHASQEKTNPKQQFIKFIEPRFYQQSEKLAQNGYVFTLFQTRHIVAGSLHETYPILVGRTSGVSMIIAKSPMGRLLLMQPQQGWSVVPERLVTQVFNKLVEVDQLNLL